MFFGDFYKEEKGTSATSLSLLYFFCFPCPAGRGNSLEILIPFPAKAEGIVRRF